jgi:hypothetical protein
MKKLDTVEKEAQDRGYLAGNCGFSCSPGTYGYHKYPNLAAAYCRGWKLGHADYEKHMKEVSK